MKKAIVNLATRPNDQRGQKRMEKSLKQHAPDVDLFLFTDERQIGAPDHRDVPYGFKTFAIDYVRDRGYDKILWLDASIWAVADITPVWDYLDEHPIMFQESGHMVGTWTNDRCLEAFNMSRDDAMDVRMIWAGFQGINFTDPFAKLYFDIYHKYGKDGMLFRGAWNNQGQTESADRRCEGHRHDQSVASLIVDKLNIKITEKQFAVYVGGPYGHKEGGEICFWAQGMP
jgi:hypothetical protein